MVWFFAGPVLGLFLLCVAVSIDWDEKPDPIYIWKDILEFAAKVLVIVGIVLVVFSYLAGITTPTEYEPVTVYIATESGVIEQVRGDYYKDSAGNYYQKEEDLRKVWLTPFYQPEYVQVDAPVFETENLIPHSQIVLPAPDNDQP